MLFQCIFKVTVHELKKIEKQLEVDVKSEICQCPSKKSSSYGILDIRPGCAITMIIGHSIQAGPEKMSKHIRVLSLKASGQQSRDIKFGALNYQLRPHEEMQQAWLKWEL